MARRRNGKEGEERRERKFRWKSERGLEVGLIFSWLIEGDEQRDERHDIDFMGDKVGTTANSIQWLADLYDPLKWSRVPGKLGKDCRKELEFFLESLRDGKLWAAKSE